MKYEILEHTADVKFRAFGRNLEEAFSNAISAFSSLVLKGGKVKYIKKKKVSIKEKDKKSLLYDFLNELVFLFDSEGFIAGKGEVKIHQNKLEAVLYGDNASNYSELEHVKAVTYSEMQIIKEKNQWIVQVVLDV